MNTISHHRVYSELDKCDVNIMLIALISHGRELMYTVSQ